MRLSLLIQATERVTGPVRRIRSSIRGMGRDGERDVGGLGRAMDRLRSIGARAGTGFATALRSRVAAGLSGLTATVRRSAASLGRTLSSALRTTLTAGAIGVAGGISYLLYQLLSGPIRIGSQFEQFSAQLEGIEGGAAGAQRALAWVRRFARDTPYEIDEVTDAFVRARGVGINPYAGAFRSLGDAASGARKSIMDAVEAVADAQTGEFERLKEFNITTSVSGDNVSFSFIDRAGRAVTRRVRKNIADIRNGVLQIFEEKYGGGMIRQSQTMLGIWNNLKDVASEFMLNIANAGVFDWLKGRLQTLYSRVVQFSSDGTLTQWAQRVSDWMVRAGTAVSNWVEGGGLQRLAADLGKVAEAAMAVVRALQWVKRQIDAVSASQQPGGWIHTFRRINPISGAYHRYRDQLEAAEQQQRAGAARPRAAGQPRGAPYYNPRGRFPGLPGSAPRLGPPARSPGASLRPGPAPLQRVRSEVTLRLEGPPEARSRVRSIRSDGELTVMRGLIGLG
ncbi:MAG TPA: tape measure protein [Allosphingosinicella sp.]|jgi:hypothetical protein